MKIDEIKTDKKERYHSPLKKKRLPIFKIATIVVVLAVLLSLMIFLYNVFFNKNDDKLSQLPTSENTQYSKLNPKEISSQTTESIEQQTSPSKKLIISGEITDMLKTDELSANNANNGAELYLLDPNSLEIKEIYLLPNSEYTLHIMESLTLAPLLEYAKQNQLINYWIYEIKQDTARSFHLVMGYFKTEAEAEQEREYLTNKLHRQEMMIMSGLDINNQKKAIKQ